MKNIHFRRIFHIIGICLVFESIFMLSIVPVSYYYGEIVIFQDLLAVLITFGSGVLLFFAEKRRGSKDLNIKESFIIVSLTWIFISLFGTLPYLTTNSIPSFFDAFFESVSGFTTTGSSILVDIEILPKSILLWRALTHWIGGMGIIVLVIALLPFLKVGSNHLISAEGSLFATQKIKPRLIDVAKRLWFIYFLLTLFEVIALTIAGMPLFDSICHSFATIATGGFSTKNSSIIDYSPTIQYIITIFMFLSGVNFIVHYLLFHGKVKNIFKDDELKGYFVVVLIAGFLVTFSTLSYYDGDFEKSFRQAFFNVVSLITCTGFASADYEKWSGFAMMIIFFTMFIGGCVGSTAGGIKVARFVIFFKSIRNTLRKIINPNSVRLVRFNGHFIDNQLTKSVLTYITFYMLTFIFGGLFMMAFGQDVQTSFSSVITTLGGIGPGFGKVGPVENFAGIPVVCKIYLSFNMIVGRLELLPFLILFNPRFYKL